MPRCRAGTTNWNLDVVGAYRAEMRDAGFGIVTRCPRALPAVQIFLDTKCKICYMKCPFCGDQDSKVVDSRHSEDGLSIRRRRECMACQRRFTTYEIVESLPIIVVKRNGSRQSFDRNKILNSMIRAFDKRKVNVEDLDRITTEIEQTIQNSLEREITTDKLGEMILERLKPLDEVAYIRFASVYRRFQDANSFIREINKVLEE